MTNIFEMNLQLFAEMNTNTTLSSGLSVENKTFYDKTLLVEAQPLLVHDQFAQKRPIPKNGGKNIEFRKFASLPKATTPLTEGVTPDGKSLSVTAITAEVAQYGDYVVYSDVLDLTAIDPVVTEGVKVIGNQAGLTPAPTGEIPQAGGDILKHRKHRGQRRKAHENEEQTAPDPSTGEAVKNIGQGFKHQAGAACRLHIKGKAGRQHDHTGRDGYKGIQNTHVHRFPHEGSILAQVAAENSHGADAQAQGEERLVHGRYDHIHNASFGEPLPIRQQIEFYALHTAV